MSTETFRIRDKGTVIRLAITEDNEVVDIHTGTNPMMFFRRPDGLEKAVSATIVQDGEDYKLEYTVEEDFFRHAGNWYVQGHITLGDWEGTSTKVPFKIERAFTIS